MGEILENTFNKLETDKKYKDEEYLDLIRLARENGQFKENRTPEQRAKLAELESPIFYESVVSDFDREQSQVFLLTGPKIEVE